MCKLEAQLLLRGKAYTCAFPVFTQSITWTERQSSKAHKFRASKPTGFHVRCLRTDHTFQKKGHIPVTADQTLPAGVPLPLRIGTRGSPLALWQADAVRGALIQAWPALAAGEALQIVRVQTTGDRVTDRPLSEIGGKGLFAKEIESALLEGHVHVGVHSMKDMETQLPDGLEIAAMLPREDVRDVLVAGEAKAVADLKPGAVVGTASLRRQAQVLALRPDLKPVLLRGNVGTRIDKISAGDADATFLALAGLRRLGLEDAGTPLPVQAMLPAVGQGAIGLEILDQAPEGLRELLSSINHRETFQAVSAERTFLAALDGSCRTPIAGLVQCADGNAAKFDGLLARPDGSRIWRADRKGQLEDMSAMAADAGQEIRAAAGSEIDVLLAPV